MAMLRIGILIKSARNYCISTAKVQVARIKSVNGLLLTIFCMYGFLQISTKNLLKIANSGSLGPFIAEKLRGEGAKRIKTQKTKQAKPDLHWGVVVGGIVCFDLLHD